MRTLSKAGLAFGAVVQHRPPRHPASIYVVACAGEFSGHTVSRISEDARLAWKRISALRARYYRRELWARWRRLLPRIGSARAPAGK